MSPIYLWNTKLKLLGYYFITFVKTLSGHMKTKQNLGFLVYISITHIFDSQVFEDYMQLKTVVICTEWTFTFPLWFPFISVHATWFCSAVRVPKLFVSKALSFPHDLRKVKVNGSYLCLQSAAEHKGHANRTNVVISVLEMVLHCWSFLQHFIRKKVQCTSISQNLDAHQTSFCKWSWKTEWADRCACTCICV